MKKSKLLESAVMGLALVFLFSACGSRNQEQKNLKAMIDGLQTSAPQASSARLEHRIKKDRTVNSVRVYEAGGADMRDKEYAALDYRVLALNADGASALVVGRPVVEAADPRAAALAILEECGGRG